MRTILEHERPLVVFLFELASLPLPSMDMQVEPMSDGGMGSLAIAPSDKTRRFGQAIAECHFHDIDGVLVEAVLNLDQSGDPFEVDIWKADFSPLQRWPGRESLIPGLPK